MDQVGEFCTVKKDPQKAGAKADKPQAGLSASCEVTARAVVVQVPCGKARKHQRKAICATPMAPLEFHLRRFGQLTGQQQSSPPNHLSCAPTQPTGPTRPLPRLFGGPPGSRGPSSSGLGS